MSEDKNLPDNVFPFEKPKKKNNPAFRTTTLEELKARMKEQGFKPFDKQEWKKKVQKQQNPQAGNFLKGSEADIVTGIRELQEVCRILSHNLKEIHYEVENRITNLEGQVDQLQTQLVELARVVKDITLILSK